MMRWILIALLLSSGTLLGQSQSQPPADQDQQKQPSLVELARQARERREKARAARVITNADLSSLRSNVSTGSAPAPATPEAVTEGAAAAAEGEQEGLPTGDPGQLTPEELDQWRQAFNEARLKLQNAVAEGLVLQLRMNNLNNAFLRQADGATQERVQAQLQQTMQAIEKNRDAQRDARRAIEELQREARSAGLTSKQISDLTGTLPEPNPEILTPESIP